LHGRTSISTPGAALARREAFRLGDTLIAPASREVRGPAGALTIEPRVMQVLLALADADGAVVTREELLRICWNGQFVGDDALNRAIAEVRRVARTVAGDGFVVETIPRTGYRLVAGETTAPEASGARLSRRTIFAGAGALGAAGAGIAAWALWPDADAARARDLDAQAMLAANTDTAEGYQRAVTLLREAVALRPRDGRLWGRLAIARRATTEYASAGGTDAAVQGCELAAARALALDPKQADARTALSLLRPSYGDWLVTERKLLDVLADAPDQGEAIDALAMLYHGTGRCRESAGLAERVDLRDPLTPLRQYRRTYHLWSTGRMAEADRTSDRAIQLWPRHMGVWLARLYLMAFTGRVGVARAQVEDIDGRPGGMSDHAVELLRLSLEALESRRPASVDAAVAAHLAEAMKGPAGAIAGVLFLNALGRLDEAFAVAQGYLLRRGARVMPLNRARTQPVIGDQHQRKTMMLFIPISSPMRADPRFLDLCEGCGLADYWRQSGHWPDFLGSRRI
jgi:DNA-binding winged helix-turn-helix (wHTH) protein